MFPTDGQGDIGEIRIQITTAPPEKPTENEAEAAQDETKLTSSAHTPEGNGYGHVFVVFAC